MKMLPQFAGFCIAATLAACSVRGVTFTPDGQLTEDCGAAGDEDGTSNDTAIGLGLRDNAADQRGAGYECLSSLCSAGNVDTGGGGLLWGSN